MTATPHAAPAPWRPPPPGPQAPPAADVPAAASHRAFDEQAVAAEMAQRERRERIHRALIYVALLCAAAIFMLPFAWSVLTSFKTVQEAAAGTSLLPQTPTIEGYRTALTGYPFAKYFLHSTLIAMAITVSNLLFCSLGGYAFARFEFPGRSLLFAAVLGCMMLPDQLRMVPVFRIMRELGLVDTYTSVWLVGAVAPFGLFFMRQAFLSLPKELEEAARLDGAGPFTTYWKVMLPLTGPSLATLAILTFQAAWNEFFWPLLFIQSPEKYTLSQGLALFTSQFETQWPALMAGTVIATIPILALYVAFQKHFVAGVAAGSVKG